MARISRDEHPKILRAVDVERRRVVDVAADYGCTAANIYGLLTRLRRESLEGNVAITQAPRPLPSLVGVRRSGSNRLKPRSNQAPVEPTVTYNGQRPIETGSAGPFPVEQVRKSKTHPQARLKDLPSPSSSHVSAGRLPESTAVWEERSPKIGFALVMRTSDGEEEVKPFRSLEDLLMASKPLLRSVSQAPEPVWFSIQRVELDSLEEEAA